MAPHVATFFHDRVRGQGGMAKELITFWVKQGYFTVDGDNQIIGGPLQHLLLPLVRDPLSPAGPCVEDPKALATPLPASITTLTHARLDRLTVTQQMVLKVAAVVGDAFAASAIYAGYPLEDGGNIDAALYTLVDLRVRQAVSCPLSAVCCLMSAVCCLLCVVCCLLPAVCCLLSAVGCLRSAVWYLLSAVCCLLPAACCLLSSVSCLVPAVCCLIKALCGAYGPPVVWR
jgi:hypothetical protein